MEPLLDLHNTHLEGLDTFLIAARTRAPHTLDGVPVVPVPLVLVRLAAGKWPLAGG